MRKLIILLIFVFCLCLPVLNMVRGTEGEIVLNASVLEAGSVIEQEGLRMQTVKCEILTGEYKGRIEELQVPLDSSFLRPVKAGDRIRVSLASIGEEQYFQFYDFARSRNYIWLFVLFVIIIIVIVGWKGIKTLLPSFLLVLFLIVGIIPDLLHKTSLILASLFLVGALAAITSWVRIRHKLLTIIVPFSVILCLMLAFLVFVGFSQSAYVVPFIGSITLVDDDLYKKVVDTIMVSIIFIPAGGVINASIQVAKYIIDKFGRKVNLSISEMLKEGLRVSQKISAGELNNLIILMIGISFSGIFLIKELYPNLSFWDNGWVSLQVIYTISAGLSILLITPITVFISAALIGLSQGSAKLKGQRRMKRLI